MNKLNIVIRKASSLVILILHNVAWLYESLFPFTLTLKSSFHQIDLDKKNIIFIVPHADDELLGAGNLLKQYNKTKLIYCGFTGSNNNLDNKVLRYNEFLNYCNKFNFQHINLNDIQSVKETLLAADYIFLPSIVDWHHEHRQVNWMVLQWCKELKIKPALIWYSLSVPIIYKSSIYYKPVTRRDLNSKYKEFKEIYRSQSCIPILRFKAKEKIYGREINVYAAEKFLLLSIEELDKILQRYISLNLKDDIEKLKSDINNLKQINNSSRLLYQKLLT